MMPVCIFIEISRPILYIVIHSNLLSLEGFKIREAKLEVCDITFRGNIMIHTIT